MPTPNPVDAAALYGVPDGDDYDETTAAEFGGRFACSLCAENRDAGERAERQLKRAEALLKLIARAELRPAKREALEENPHELALIGYAQAFAGIRARIELYLDTTQ